MTKTVFNTKKVDFTKQYMFFGEDQGVARYDIQKYPRIDKFTEKQLSFFWRPEEIDVTRDRADYNSMQEHEKHIFLSNIKYQTLLDSVQGRAPSLAFLPICSLPELETWIDTWTFSETIHSRSYTHLIRNVINDPSEVFDSILDTPEIVARAKPITETYDDLINSFHDGSSLSEQKVNLFKSMVTTYALEAIRFYVSFACTFAFGEQERMEGNAKIMSLIARDEFLHQGFTHFSITRWLGGLDDPEMTDIAMANLGYIRDTLQVVAEQEMQWSNYLFQGGSVIGLNEKLLNDYLYYLVDARLEDIMAPTIQGNKKDLGFKPIYGSPKNPLPWMDSWLKSSAAQPAPQETELRSYLVGQVDADLGDDFLEDLDI